MRSVHLNVALLSALLARQAVNCQLACDAVEAKLADIETYPHVAPASYKWDKVPPHEMSRPQYKNLVLKNSRRGRARKRR